MFTTCTTPPSAARTKESNMRRSLLAVTITGALLPGGSSVVSAHQPETGNVMAQGGAVYAPGHSEVFTLGALVFNHRVRRIDT